MTLPIVAVVGRPNVGKSTFVNRIAQTEEAIVHSSRGVTRDRSYHTAEWAGKHFMLIDTGGIEVSKDDAFQASIRAQAQVATEEADVIVFLVDGKSGVTSDDEEVANLLKRAKKPVFLAVNKVDNPGSEAETYEFWSLGLGTPHPISSTHGHGTGDLLDEVVATLPVVEEPQDDGALSVALIGRPNAGKSSLANRLTGTERSIVSDVAGTTRDAIDTTIVRDGVLYRFVDTAGLRKKSAIDEDIEYYGFVRAMRAIDRAQIALLVIDATVGLTDQDQRIASYAADRGCGMAIVLNKWDLMDDPEEKERLLSHIEDRLDFISWAPLIRVSALTGKNTQKIFDHLLTIYAHYRQEIPTSALNRLLTEMRDFGHTINKGGKSLRLNYVTQTHVAPPGFTFFANFPQIIDDNYRRYVENRMRDAFDFSGTPIYLKFKKKDSGC